MLELLAFVTLGICAGVLTGLLPALHVNNLAPFIVTACIASSFSPMNFVAMIVAMAITNTFICFIPSTFLGAPEVGSELSVLPAHRLLLEGNGYEAIRLTTLGCLGSLMLSAALSVPLSLVFAPIYGSIQPLMHWLLIAVVVTMIAVEHSRSGILWGMAIFFLSGLLGLLTLDTGLLKGDTAMVPLLSGLFGLSVLIPSALRKSALPKQRVDEGGEIELRPRALLAGVGSGIFTGFVPGIGPSQGTVLAQLATRSSGAREFLVGVSGVNTAKALFSFVALYAIAKPRSGAAVAVYQLMDRIGLRELIFLMGVALLSGGIAAVLALRLGKLAARHIRFLPYRKLCMVVIAFIAAVSFLYAGAVGLLILATATVIGMLPALTKVKRTHCMGVIILPCILHFAGAKDGLLGVLGL